jgi:tetratricopeptide (TPR) repeat protein
LYFIPGQRDAYLRCSDEALALGEGLGDEAQLTHPLSVRTNALCFAGDNASALETGRRGLALAAGAGDIVYRIHLNVNVGPVYASVGDHRRAVDLFASAVELLRGDLERDRLGRTLYPSVLARNELVASYADLGAFDPVRATSADALRIADALGHSASLIMARLEVAESLVRPGNFAQAIPRLEVDVQRFRDAGLLTWSTSAAALLGYSYAMTGRLREGLALIREAIDQLSQGRRTREAFFAALLCEAHLRDGEVAET